MASLESRIEMIVEVANTRAMVGSRFWRHAGTKNAILCKVRDKSPSVIGLFSVSSEVGANVEGWWFLTVIPIQETRSPSPASAGLVHGP
jgi:hypothetical protein